MKRLLKEFSFPSSKIVKCWISEATEDAPAAKQALVRHYAHATSKNGTRFTKDSAESFRVVLEEAPVMFCNHKDWEPFSRDIQDAVSFHVKGTFESREDGVYSIVQFYEKTELAEEVFAKAKATPLHVGISVHGYCEADEEELEDGSTILTPIVWVALASSDWVFRPAAAGKLVEESWKTSSMSEMVEQISKSKNKKEIKEVSKQTEDSFMDEKIKKLLEDFKGLDATNRELLKEVLETKEKKLETITEELRVATESIETLTEEKETLEGEKTNLTSDNTKLKSDLDEVTEAKTKLDGEVQLAKDKETYVSLVEAAELPDKVKEFVLDSEKWFHKMWIGKASGELEEALKDFKENSVSDKKNLTPARNEDGTLKVDEDKVTDEELLEGLK